ncbi:MAG TPA: FtsX-like permease family protein [Vicinamibacterales bacterium]|nr:FtsX-like permease family protein [Vicinamibacterales bacterium]
MRLILLALRNAGRNRRRSATVLSLIALGSAALLLAGGYAAATFQGLRENTIRNGVGHLQITGIAGEQDDAPLAAGLDRVDDLRRVVDGDPRVRATAARVDFTGLASTGDRSVAVMGRGIEPDQEYGRAGFAPRMVEGRPLTAGEPHEALVAARLARSLGVRAGDRLTLMTATVDGAINGLDAVVVGIYTTGVRELDDRSVVVRLDTAQALLATSRVSRLVVVLDRTGHTEDVRQALVTRLASAGTPVQVQTWSELAAFYHQVRGLFSGIFAFLGLIIAIVVLLSAANAMSMAVMERVREIGTLMAVGTTRLRIMAMFVVEGLVLGALGGLLGLALGYLLARGLTAARIQMPPPPTFTTGFPLQIEVVPALYAAVLAAMVVTLGVAALLPAARAARLRITDALAHV